MPIGIKIRYCRGYNPDETVRCTSIDKERTRSIYCSDLFVIYIDAF